MNKTEFIARVAEHQEIPKTKAKEIVETVLAEICNVITDHDSVYFQELGTFGATLKEEHTSKNPSNGETITVPAKYVPTFKFGNQIKKATKATL